MSAKITPGTALAKLMKSNAADAFSTSLPEAEVELDRALGAGHFEPSVTSRRLAERLHGAEYTKAAQLLRVVPEIETALFDLRLMESDASFALGVSFGLKLAGGAK